MSVPICNCFHARLGNINKMTTFRGVGLPFFYARVRRPTRT